MSNLIILSEFAKSLGAHAPLKRQLDNNDTLFVCISEVPNNYDDGVTTWEHVITIDEIEGKVKIRFRSGKYSFLLNSEEAKQVIRMWVEDPASNFSNYYENQ